MQQPDRKFCVAPMMTHTDRHFRYFLRLISKHTMLYTEMITTGALLHGNAKKHLAFDAFEHPVGIQLGGSNPSELAKSSKMAEDFGYDELNLNVGCPSDRVKSGRFGACLMAEPALVADCIAAMQEAVNIPVTVKSRIGIDNLDSYEYLHHFIETVAQGGCRSFIIHARKAWLQGLSPRQNREIPPLHYETVYRIKKDFPHLEVIINGGIHSLEESMPHYEYVDGVMLGRAVCNNPYLLAQVDSKVFGVERHVPSRQELMSLYMEYINRQLKKGVFLKHMSRHILGLYQGLPGARAYRRYLSENIYRPDSGVEVIEQALAKIKAA